jgi:uncharacterized protein YjbJ (UPF0337 family)
MKGLPWMIAGIGLGVGIAFLVFAEQEPSYGSGYAPGYDGVERAARKTYGWGTKARVKGTVESVAGAVKEGVGRLTGNDDLTSEGLVERTVGDLKDAAGTVGHAVGETIHDLNR